MFNWFGSASSRDRLHSLRLSIREQWKYWRSLSRRAIFSALASKSARDLSQAKPITVSNTTILAVGAAGPFAGLVVPALVNRGAKVRGLTREGKQGAAEVVAGDLRDRSSLDATLKGVDAIFYIAPAFNVDAEAICIESSSSRNIRPVTIQLNNET